MYKMYKKIGDLKKSNDFLVITDAVVPQHNQCMESNMELNLSTSTVMLKNVLYELLNNKNTVR